MAQNLNFAPTLRRLRQNSHIRELTQTVRVSVDQMIQPLFTVQGLKERQAVPGLSGVYRETDDSLLKQIENDLEKGVRKFLLFGVPAIKGKSDFDPSFTTSQIAKIKKTFGHDLWLSVDVCLCSSTEHGHCGVLDAENHRIDNQKTVTELAHTALSFAQAGADCVAPSDMMDGRIAAIRSSLSQADLDLTLVMSYSAKFHSKFYGPFRVAADSAPKGASGSHPNLKDRATYQIDPKRPEDARLCSLRDLSEGADILMVKPGMPYLDILSQLSHEIQVPWAVYEVSGEYASIELLAKEGLMDAPLAHLEAWTSLARAGASMIITYGARHARAWLQTSR